MPLALQISLQFTIFVVFFGLGFFLFCWGGWGCFVVVVIVLEQGGSGAVYSITAPAQ